MKHSELEGRLEYRSPGYKQVSASAYRFRQVRELEDLQLPGLPLLQEPVRGSEVFGLARGYHLPARLFVGDSHRIVSRLNELVEDAELKSHVTLDYYRLGPVI